MGRKKMGNSENIFKTGHLRNMGDPWTFYVIRTSTHVSFQLSRHWFAILVTTHVSFHVSLLLFAFLAYPLNLEASTRETIGPFMREK